jgi:hypothetical protein
MVKIVCGNEALYLHIFEWFKRLRERHEDLEDDARWAAISCSESGNNCEIYKLLARDYQMTQKWMVDQLCIK